MDRPPATLDPRMALDATGQRLGELVFRSLTRMDRNLRPQPDLAERWEIDEGGKVWRFTLREGQGDQANEPITAARMTTCLENYRRGAIPSPLVSAFPAWISTERAGRQIIIRLSRPDPYLASNLSLIRYFWTESPDRPCLEPQPGQTLTASGPYRPVSLKAEELSPENEFDVRPWSSDAGSRPLHFVFVMDDNTRAFKIIRGEVDATEYALSSAKTRRIQKAYTDRFQVLEHEGVSVAYLSFNMRDPILADRLVRRAIAQAIDRQSYISTKMFGFGSLAGSLLSPLLPESHQEPRSYDPERSEELLERAGYRRGKDGVRLRLRYKTTPIRDGFEQALVFQNMLRKIGIDLTIEVVEPSVFLASVRKGAYQLYSSRWIGVGDGSILYRTLRSGNRDNRAGYSNPEMDRLLDLAMAEPDLGRRAAILGKVQIKMAEDLPYFPLWYWSGALILKKGLAGVGAGDISLSGSLVPLTHLN